MKHIATILLVVAGLFSCSLILDSAPVRGNGKAATKTVVISDFDAISVLGSLDVVYTPDGRTPSAILYTDENLLDLYTVEVVGTELIVSTVHGKNPMPRTKSYLLLSGPVADSFSVTGSADIEVTSTIRVAGDVKFSVTGSGDVDAPQVECRTFTAKVTGSGDMDFGTVVAADAAFKITGSGDIEVDYLTADAIVMSVSGSGDIEANCRNCGSIDANISGSGDIVLSGNARSLNVSSSGSGRVHSASLSLSGR